MITSKPGVNVVNRVNQTIGDRFEHSGPDPRAALFFLAAPAFLFLLFFAERLVGLAISGLLLAALVSTWNETRPVSFRRLVIVAPLTLALVVAFTTGFPAGPFCWDWVKHWALINELASHRWPFSNELQGTTRHLRFYIAAYLVPAGLHQVFHGLPVWISAGAWFTLGYALVLRMVASVASSRQMSWFALAVFLILGGADSFAEHGYRALDGLPAVPWLGLHFENWAYHATQRPLEYSSILTALVWVPHQSIAAFLVASLLVLSRGPQALRAAMVGYGLLALWSPYAMIGLIPLMLVRGLQDARFLFTSRSGLCLIAGASFALLVAAYLSTDVPSAGACITCFTSRLGDLPDFFLFGLVELGVFVLILRRLIITDTTCLVSLLTLMLIPFMYGETADFVMRASMGPLFVLAIRSTQVVVAGSVAGWRKAAQVAAICLCLPTAASEFTYQLQAGTTHGQFPESDPLGAKWIRTFATRTDYDAQSFFELCGWGYVDQYFAKRPPLGVRHGKAGTD